MPISKIKLKTSMLKSSLFNNSDAYILVKGTSNQNNEQTDRESKKVILKGCTPFTDCIVK